MSEPRAEGVDALLTEMVCNATGATGIRSASLVQSLWSGYGQILRCALEGGDSESVIVKRVRWPDEQDHPRGWNSSRSHERKVRSYEVEAHWYAQLASQCDDSCRVPAHLGQFARGAETFLVLEDLNPSGYPLRLDAVGEAELRACLSWLANFHASFMGHGSDGLWPVGTYWHLDTRPDELEALQDEELRRVAPILDRVLSSTPHLTLVHGDAKLANFCFSEDGRGVAAVDFQYVGGGCGMKDLAYFVSSCLHEEEAEKREDEILDGYFDLLGSALQGRGASLSRAEIEEEWRPLYRVAWTDFFRFLQGWSPGHWKIHRYSQGVARQVLETL